WLEAAVAAGSSPACLAGCSGPRPACGSTTASSAAIPIPLGEQGPMAATVRIPVTKRIPVTPAAATITAIPAATRAVAMPAAVVIGVAVEAVTPAAAGAISVEAGEATG